VDGWYVCQDVCNLIEKHCNPIDKVHLKYSSIKEDNEGYWFYLNEKSKAEFEQGSYDEQKALLREFFREVIMFPLSLEK